MPSHRGDDCFPSERLSSGCSLPISFLLSGCSISVTLPGCSAFIFSPVLFPCCYSISAAPGLKSPPYTLTKSKSSTLSHAKVISIQLPDKYHHFSPKASKCLSPKLNSVSSHSQIHYPLLVFMVQIPMYPLTPNQKSRYHPSFLSFLLIPSLLFPEISKYTLQFSLG